MDHKPIPTISAEASILHNRLRKLKPGETVTYVELSRTCGMDVTTDKGRGRLETARQAALREDGFVIESVRGLGVKRLEDEEKLAIGDQVRKRTRRAAVRAGRKLSRIDDYEALTREQKSELNAHRTYVGAVALFSTAAARRQVRELTDQANDTIAARKALEMFATSGI